MKIAIFGGSGKAGQYVMRELLERRHFIKALIRNPSKINHFINRYNNLEIIKGDVLNKEDVIKTISNTESVIVTIGRQRNSPPNLQLDSIKIIHDGMLQNHIKRIVVLTGAALYIPEDKPKFIDEVLRYLIKIIDPLRLKDAENMVDFLVQTQLDWTIVRTHLHHSYKSDQLSIGKVGDSNIKLFCSRQNIAKFIVNCIEGGLYIKQAPVISD